MAIRMLLTVVTLLLALPLCAEDGKSDSSQATEARLKRLENLVERQAAALAQTQQDLNKRNARITELENAFKDSQVTRKVQERAYYNAPSKSTGGGDIITVSFSKGLRFKTADGQHSFKLGGRIMQDWKWASHVNEYEQLGLDSEDGTEMRRARFYMAGTYYKNLFWKAQFDFSNGSLASKDLVFGLTNLPVVGNWSVGHFKEPFSLEESTSSKYITFMERSVVSMFSPSRNPGMAFYNHQLDQRLTWALGVFKSATDTRIQDDDGVNVTGRVTGLPFYRDGGRHLLHLGLAGSWRKPNDHEVRFRSRPEVHLANRFIDTGTFNAEQDTRLGAELAWVYGPASLQAEWAGSWTDRTDRALDGADERSDGNAFFSGAYVQFSYFVTGERRNYNRKSGAFGRIKPKKNFWDGLNALGAVELAVRYSYLDLTDENLDGGRLSDITFGVNWHLNPNTRIMLNYVLADVDRKYTDLNGFDRTLNGKNQNFMMRFQLDF